MGGESRNISCASSENQVGQIIIIRSSMRRSARAAPIDASYSSLSLQLGLVYMAGSGIHRHIVSHQVGGPKWRRQGAGWPRRPVQLPPLKGRLWSLLSALT